VAYRPAPGSLKLAPRSRRANPVCLG
jgi:hypothetical protein